MQMASTEEMGDKISSELDRLKNQFEEFSKHEMTIFRKEILREIKVEIASRYAGTEGKVKESLDYDKQFQTALNILKDSVVYKRLLNYH